jgi:hypothetical protein
MATVMVLLRKVEEGGGVLRPLVSRFTYLHLGAMSVLNFRHWVIRAAGLSNPWSHDMLSCFLRPKKCYKRDALAYFECLDSGRRVM